MPNECRSLKLLLATLPLTSICFQPLKPSAAMAGNHDPRSLLSGRVTGGMNCVVVVVVAMSVTNSAWSSSASSDACE